ncbi:hypothetical protein [Flavobacterium sp.]|uniref:hypothetical protein n=1 Tax=Flavobacterium sp. TaxID=239 RepID=UPI002630BFC2|nr:hypothetical protein [Flavobacterium sp.]
MSYIIYINGNEIEEIDSKAIAINIQNNDLARLDNRQSNFMHKITAPLTAKNIRAMKNVYLVGNQSNVPYQINRFDLIDGDTGKHIIYNGIAIVSMSNKKGYEIHAYSGILEFFKAIENKTLTDCGISELNHLKNLSTIINSWEDTQPYKYIIADYNGKVLTDDGMLNADYLVPSARYSYLWQKVHEFAGFTYSGLVFESEKFLNWYMTFPKPVPTEEPNYINQTIQNSVNIVTPYYNEGMLFPFIINPFPTPYTNTESNNIGNPTGTINITQTGAFSFRCYGNVTVPGIGLITQLHYQSLDAMGNLIEEGDFNPTIDLRVIVNCEAGGKLMIINYSLGFGSYAALPSGTLETTLDLIEGYTASFDEALIDFPIKDFVNELMQHFALTPFKDKYSNHIVYKSLDEILQGTDIIDVSDYFVSKENEKYILGNYGKKNNYKYRYNNDNETHNDGFITINNENLKDEVTILSSKLYSPEKRKSMVLGLEMNVYKIWEKEIKDDMSIDYKDLSGRYYGLRSEDKNFISLQNIKSEALNVSDTFTIAPIENFYRLKLQQVIYDNYNSIESLLDKAKVKEIMLDIPLVKLEELPLDKLIYVSQEASYYFVNRIINAVKNQPVKFEVFEVDYFKEIPVPEPIEYYIDLGSISVTGCQVTFNIDTNLPQPTEVFIQPYSLSPDGLGGFYFAPVGEPISATLNSNQVIHNFTEIPPSWSSYKFMIFYNGSSVFEQINTSLSDVVPVSTSCYVSTAPNPTLSTIQITNISRVLLGGNVRKITLTYESDLSDTYMALTLSASGFTYTPPVTNMFSTQNGTFEIELPHLFYGSINVYQLQLSALSITSNIVTSDY